MLIQALTRGQEVIQVTNVTEAEKVAWSYLQSFASPSILENLTFRRTSDDYYDYIFKRHHCYRIYYELKSEIPRVQNLTSTNITLYNHLGPFYVDVYPNGTAWINPAHNAYLENPNEMRMDPCTALQVAENATGKKFTSIDLWILEKRTWMYWKKLTAEGRLCYELWSEALLVKDKNEKEFWERWCAENTKEFFSEAIYLCIFVDATTGEIIGESTRPSGYGDLEELNILGFTLYDLPPKVMQFLRENWVSIALSFCVAWPITLFCQYKELREKLFRYLKCVKPIRRRDF